jgi:hypothetical protein
VSVATKTVVLSANAKIAVIAIHPGAERYKSANIAVYRPECVPSSKR